MHKIHIKGARKQSSPVWLLPSNIFASVVAESNSIVAIQKALGYKSTSGSIAAMIKQRISSEGLSISHFRGAYAESRPQRKLKDILVRHSTYMGRQTLKKRLIAAGMLLDKCAACGQEAKWNNKPLVLQLDHINGVHDDNRVKNLRLLCPNCHSQTNTFSGRSIGQKDKSFFNLLDIRRECPSCKNDFKPKTLGQVYCKEQCQPGRIRRKLKGTKRVVKVLVYKWCAVCGRRFTDSKNSQVKCCSSTCGHTYRRKVTRPNRQALYRMVWKYPTLAVAQKLGVSDSAVAKWCKTYGIEKPPRGYWTKKQTNKTK